MKTAQLSGSARANVGKKEAAAARNAGLVPCVLYGTGEQTHFTVKRVELDKIIFSPEVYLVELEIDGKKSTAIVQDLQQHPTKDTIQHVDFLQTSDSKEIKIGLPVRLTGASRGVLAGGRLQQVFRNLKVVGLTKQLPDAITLDIAKLRIGQAIRVRDIAIDGVKFLDPAGAVVVSVKMARGAVKGADVDDEEDED
ncbi:MAG: 50S ribosomal protein L25 [Bacteroidota bacterium]